MNKIEKGNKKKLKSSAHGIVNEKQKSTVLFIKCISSEIYICYSGDHFDCFNGLFVSVLQTQR